MKKYLLLMVFAVILMWNGCKKDENASEIKADFSFLITGNPGEVAFTNKSENAQTYEWDFGDGKASTMKSPVHVYDFNDTYYVKLIAFGSQKNATFNDTIIITNVVKK
ncbi:MAG: PKD domain-containing protein [Bacteroidales bacterium]|jgi:PKD repeat protein